MKYAKAGLLIGAIGLLACVHLAASEKKPSEKPLVVVRVFTTAENTWPYDMKKMQAVTASEIKSICTQYEVTTDELASGRAHYYTLTGEVLSWHPGARHFPAYSRENAEI
jgi:hypothetical protein